jgi:predicted  nucleic acid-binding Zn-ribbon protein
MNDLILHPEYESLRAEVARLREEIVVVRTQLDRATGVETELLKAEYGKRFGRLELELTRKYYRFRLLRRRIDLVRSYLNRGAEPDMEAIDAILDAEAEEYNQVLRRKAADAERASKMTFREYSDEEAVHAKKLYQQVVRALHPDLHPGATPDDIACLQQAVEAYNSGDLATLEAIAVLVECGEKKNDEPSCIESLRKRCEQYRDTLSKLALRLKKVRSSFPFDQAELLSKPENVMKRIQDLKAECAKLDDRIAACEIHLQQLNGTV